MIYLFCAVFLETVEERDRKAEREGERRRLRGNDPGQK